MSTSTKSVKKLLRVAHQVSSEGLSAYSSSKSKKTYTQPQLFSCLVLKIFLKMDYRGTSIFLEDFKEAREEIGLKKVPHFTALQKACQRLLSVSQARTLLEETLREFSLKKFD